MQPPGNFALTLEDFERGLLAHETDSKLDFVLTRFFLSDRKHASWLPAVRSPPPSWLPSARASDINCAG